MTRYLVLCFLLAVVTDASVGGSRSGWPEIEAHVEKAGLVLDGSGTSPHDASSDESRSCAHVSFSRNLKYGESDLNVVDVATGDVRETSPRPVLLFVAGESFAGDNGAPDMAGALQGRARRGALGPGQAGGGGERTVAAPHPRRPAGAEIAAAISWVHQNIDLFG